MLIDPLCAPECRNMLVKASWIMRKIAVSNSDLRRTKSGGSTSNNEDVCSTYHLSSTSSEQNPGPIAARML